MTKSEAGSVSELDGPASTLHYNDTDDSAAEGVQTRAAAKRSAAALNSDECVERKRRKTGAGRKGNHDDRSTLMYDDEPDEQDLSGFDAPDGAMHPSGWLRLAAAMLLRW